MSEKKKGGGVGQRIKGEHREEEVSDLDIYLF